MPWLTESRKSSPMSSPRAPSAVGAGTASPHAERQPRAIVYIPPLIDGACGTEPRAAQRLAPGSSLARLRADARALASVLPELTWAAWACAAGRPAQAGGKKRWGVQVRRPGPDDLADLGEMAVHLALGLVSGSVVFLAVPLWFALPGFLFALWAAAAASLVLGLGRLLNGRGSGGGGSDVVVVHRCPADADADVDGGSGSWMMGPEQDCERWFFVGGLGLSPRQMARSTLPLLSRLFNRSVTGIPTRTYGLPLDLLYGLLQRGIGGGVQLPAPASGVLCAQLRAALQDPSVTRAVVFAHGFGAMAVSQVLEGLYADLPGDKIAKLEVYTFGAAAAEFVIPLGESLGRQQHQQAQNGVGGGGGGSHELVMDRRTPHIEHFAHASDPLARFGILRSVREDLQSRFCGGVFEIHGRAGPGCMSNGNSNDDWHGILERKGKEGRTRRRSRPVVSVQDYLACLFPEQMSYQQQQQNDVGDDKGLENKGQQQPYQGRLSSVLDDIMAIDRDVAEKREFAAMASYVSAAHSRRDSLGLGLTGTSTSTGTGGAGGENNGGGQRLSWTGLGATVGGKSGVMDGVRGLEMARRGCRDCSGHRGSEVSWLVRYVGGVGGSSYVVNAGGVAGSGNGSSRSSGGNGSVREARRSLDGTRASSSSSSSVKASRRAR